MISATVEANGLLFNGPADGNGVRFTWSRLDGWGPSAPTGGGQQRQGAHGGTAPTQWYGPKTMAAQGLILAPDRLSRQIAEQELYAALSLDLFTLTVVEEIPLQVRARLNGPFGWDASERRVKWSAELYCPDSFRYGTTLQTASLTLPQDTGGLRFPISFPISFTGTSSSGRVVLNNAGRARSFPLFKINGPVTDPVLTNITTGEFIKYVGTIAAGEYLIVDMAVQAAALNGVADYSGLIVGDFWSLAPGDNEIAFTANGLTAADVEIQWRDAYL